MIAGKLQNERVAVRFHAMEAILLFVALVFSVLTAQAQTDSYTTAGTTTWTAPSWVTSVTIEAWGGGGAGGGATSNPGKGGGGAGGQYASKVVTVTPGNSYTVVVGAGGPGSTGNGTAGGDSTFATNVVVAKGGAGGSVGAASGAAGAGSTTGGVGTTVYAGGSGSAGATGGGGCSNGGAGGGGAGSGGAGGSAAGNTAGTGTATGGGAGGAGTNNSGNGNAGSAAGGAGGGACAETNTDRSGGAGAAGMVNISYAAAAPAATTSAASSITTAGATLNGTVSSNGASTDVTFNYGPTTAYGSTATAAQSPLAAGASGSAVSAAVTGLNCGTLYHFQVSATNSVGTTNGSDLTFTTSACPTPVVTSINLASVNPTYTATAVAWTVVFNQSVTGVDATDFTLVQAGGVSGATITSVTGSGSTWTVNANTGSGGGTLGLNLVDDDSIVNVVGTPLGGVGAGNGNFTGQVYTISTYCSAPSNIPVGVTVSCVCDQFGRANLSPSTIYGGSWVVSTSDTTGIVPYINAGTGHLRLTENTGNNAKAATVPSIFPAAGNYISVEFQHYAYNGSNPGADGIAVTLSDYSVPAVPGAFGGSLGYAQKNQASCGVTGGCPGFAGGWLGVALDEYGNYQNPTEGRILGPGAVAESVGLRGPGSGQNGYEWMGGTGGSPGGLAIDNHASTTPAPGYMYQVVVDARNSASGTVNVSVNRDSTTKDGTSYTSLFGPFNAYTEANNAVTQGWITQVVPNFWQISFTGSTGGSTNIHEIGGLRICAQSVAPPSGGTASGFSAIDEAYGTPPAVAVQNYLKGHIYTKLVGTPFKLNVAAISNSQIVTTYALSSAQTVTVNLVDNKDGVCILDPTQPNYCNRACTSKQVVGTQTLTFAKGAGDQGQKQSPSFTINSAYQSLAATISDGTTTACSIDMFSVRPLSITSVTSTAATNINTYGSPMFKAGSAPFDLTATMPWVSGYPSGYNGIIQINSMPSNPATSAGIVGTVALPATPAAFPAATYPSVSPFGPSTANSPTFTYSEVGAFQLLGYDPATDPSSQRGAYDNTWTAVDSISSKNDCVANGYSNIKDTNGNYSNNPNFGKYGCNFGLLPNSVVFGRFIPDHFDTVTSGGMACPTGLTCPIQFNGFVYSGPASSSPGEPFTTNIYARNATGGTTQNYDGTLGLSKPTTLSAWDAAGSTTTQNPPSGSDTLNNSSVLAIAFRNGTTFAPGTPATPNYSFATTPTVPTNVYMRAQDTDGVKSLRSPASSSVEGGMMIASGQVNVSNAYGSELLPLSLTATVQYYNAAGSWVTSTTDNVDTVAAANITRQNCQGALLSGGTCSSTLGLISSVVPVPATPPPYGVFSINLAAPGLGNTGSEDLIINSVWPTWLPSSIGRATFGVYGGSSGSNNFIYQRETY